MEKKSVYANMAQKEETVQESTAFTKHGRQTNQKLKPYIVLQYLLKNTDENSVAFSYKHKKPRNHAGFEVLVEVRREKQTAAAPMPAKMRRHSGYRQNRRGALDFRWNSDEAFNDPGPDTCVRKAAEEKQKENFRQGANRNPFVHCGHRSVCRFQFSAPPSVWRCASRAGREDPGG